MKILVYYPSSYNSVFILTAIDDLIKQGHVVFLLTTTAYGVLQQGAEKLGAEVYSGARSNDIRGLFQEMYVLIKFCRKHKIDFVFPHLQYLNLVGVLSRFFIKALVFPMRHHSDNVYISGNKNARLLDQLVNLFSSQILVVSPPCKTQMMNYENVPAKKIIVLPLYYNFQFYDLSYLNVDKYLAEQPESGLQLINIGRMVKSKNHMGLLNVMQRLVTEGEDVKLTLLDTGPLEPELRDFVQHAGLRKNVVFLGRKIDVLSYIRAADLLVHTSISESGGQVIKESGICQVPVVVVKGVGDFDQYIIDRFNGFYLSKDNVEQELYETLKSICRNSTALKAMGRELDKSVRANFDVSAVKKTYMNIINGIIE
ncbi:glycosyltransferase [Pedobacter sp. L105]|uniref:glycosyltransferase n=1 Tax=Pedobacter sp. L105 TaxID=1641871 RepID=UPI00131D990E|nr:glycosyltransferase [Pedobacter sp. L105]